MIGCICPLRSSAHLEVVAHLVDGLLLPLIQAPNSMTTFSPVFLCIPAHLEVVAHLVDSLHLPLIQAPNGMTTYSPVFLCFPAHLQVVAHLVNGLNLALLKLLQAAALVVVGVEQAHLRHLEALLAHLWGIQHMAGAGSVNRGQNT